MTMSKDPYFKIYVFFGLMAAVCYAIAVAVFIEKAKYADTWVLYVGNFVFMAVIVGFLFYISSLANFNSATIPLMASAEKTVLIGVFFSCILSFVLLCILVPHILGQGPPSTAMSGNPVNRTTNQTNGLVFMIFINGIIGNIVTGSFVSILFPVSIKRNQKTEKGTSKATDL